MNNTERTSLGNPILAEHAVYFNTISIMQEKGPEKSHHKPWAIPNQRNPQRRPSSCGSHLGLTRIYQAKRTHSNKILTIRRLQHSGESENGYQSKRSYDSLVLRQR